MCSIVFKKLNTGPSNGNYIGAVVGGGGGGGGEERGNQLTMSLELAAMIDLSE